MGYSMGALHSLFIAATESTNQLPLLKFDRYVAINTPVRMLGQPFQPGGAKDHPWGAGGLEGVQTQTRLRDVLVVRQPC